MSGPKWSRCLAACALIAGLALAGCAARQTVTTRPMAAPAPSPSQTYLSKPVSSGWLRTVGRSNGLVLVFECQKVVAHEKAFRYRFVVVNESSGTRSWDDALFVVWQNNVDALKQGTVRLKNGLTYAPMQGGATTGDYPISYMGSYDFPSLLLHSGESTTHAGKLSGRLGPGNKPYLCLITPSFKGGARDRASVLASAPPITVRFE